MCYVFPHGWHGESGAGSYQTASTSALRGSKMHKAQRKCPAMGQRDTQVGPRAVVEGGVQQGWVRPLLGRG